MNEHVKPKSRLRDLCDISDKDYKHHEKRVQSMIDKANGDVDKEIKLASTMAKKIESVDKAIGRYLVAKAFNKPEMAKVFENRYKDMTETLQDRRKEKIANLLKALEEEGDDN